MRGKARAAGRCDPGLDVLAPPPSSSLPFLPTLVTALALGGLGLLCRHPAEVETAPAVLPALVISADAGGVEPVAAAPASLVPGTVAFARQFPLVVDGSSVAFRPSRLAVNARRGCAPGRCAEAKRPEPARSVAQQRPAEPSTTATIPGLPREENGRDEALPGDALPFMPTAEAMLDSARSIGSRAVTLGGSVVGSLAELN